MFAKPSARWVEFQMRSWFHVGFSIIVAAFLSCSRVPSYPAPAVEGTTVTVDVAKIPDETPVFFSLPVDDKTVRFFVIKRQGELHSFFDACQKCFPKKRGYRTDEGGVVCKACDVTYPLEELEGGLASCRPIPLPGREENGRYLIQLADIKAGCDKF